MVAAEVDDALLRHRRAGGSAGKGGALSVDTTATADASDDGTPRMVSPLNSDNYEPFVPPSPYAEHPFSWPFHLFVASKFFVHRILGLAYLVAYAWSWSAYTTNYSAYMASALPWALPLAGVCQSATAIFYFRFLPKKRADPGYYSDRGTISYACVARSTDSLDCDETSEPAPALPAMVVRLEHDTP